MKRKEIFKPFNYNEAKSKLPEGFEPLESLPVKTDNFIDDAVLKEKIIATNQILFRDLGKEQYVNDFFSEGCLLISTLNRCKKLANDERRDNFEGRTVISFMSKDLQIEGKFDFEDVNPTLVLCNSLNMPLKNKSQYIVIHNFVGFVNELRNFLRDSGFDIIRTFVGPCNYSDKKISFVAQSNYLEQIKNDPYFLSNNIHKILGENYNRIYFHKPYYFSSENEFRIIFVLTNYPSGEYKFKNLEIHDDFIIIKDKKLSSFCTRLK